MAACGLGVLFLLCFLGQTLGNHYKDGHEVRARVDSINGNVQVYL